MFMVQLMETKRKVLRTSTLFPYGLGSLLTEGRYYAGVRLRAEVRDSDKLPRQAVDLAKDADGVIAIVDLNTDWEAEGYDRATLALPGRTDELIARVAAVNAKTVVATQAVCNILS